MRWPLPALLVWAAAWALFTGLRALQAPTWAAFVAAMTAGLALAQYGSTRWRRRLIAVGFPLSLLALLPASAPPGWAWLAALGLLAMLYPLRSWRDAPLFPTPAGALAGLARSAPLADAACVVDAGCGLGDGLRELRREYPQARLVGLEWSWPLRWVCALRCRDARILRRDLWAADWSGFDMVYLFQRPESMPRAAAKAAAELRCGAWLASLEFEAPGLRPRAVHECADGRSLWLYQAPLCVAAEAAAASSR